VTRGRGAALEWSKVQRLAVPAGRLLFSLIFLATLQTHLSPMAIGYAAQQGVPFANALVPLSGVLAFAGGVSVVLGYRARLGAALLVLFLVPVTLSMHAFWVVTDPMMAAVEQAMFFKNAGLLGGALMIIGLGAGPLSLDARRSGARSR
jgi:putative oxidoreductase